MVGQLGYISATSHESWFLLAEALKIALREHIITEKDLFATDEVVWNKLTQADHSMINDYLQRLQPGKEFEYAAQEDAEFYDRNKARVYRPARTGR
jgi:hypothetical protein